MEVIVAKGRSILHDAVVLTEGQHLDLPPNKAMGLIQSGYVVAASGLLRNRVMGDDISVPPLPGGEIDAKDAITTTGGEGSIRTSSSRRQSKKNTAGQSQSHWTVDPAKLTGKSLDELNAMVKDRDEKIEPFATEAEAVAFLSQDFE